MDRMPGTKVSMRKVREVLRLKHALGMSERLIADAVGVGKTAVGEYLRRARVIGLAWPLPEGMDEAELERRLFTPAGFHNGPTKQLPAFARNGARDRSERCPRSIGINARNRRNPQ